MAANSWNTWLMAEQPTYSDLAPAEREWLDRQVELARSIGVDPADETSISDFFDGALDAVDRGTELPAIGNMVVNVVGVLIGELLCAQQGLRWAIFADKQGADLCLRYRTTSWTLFPQSSAAKRWETREVGWVRPFLAWARDSVAAPPP
jgi:hypothetical protein